MPKARAHVQTLPETLADIARLDAGLLALAKTSDGAPKDADVAASLREAQAFCAASRAAMQQGAGLDALGRQLEALKAAAGELDRGLRG